MVRAEEKCTGGAREALGTLVSGHSALPAPQPWLTGQGGLHVGLCAYLLLFLLMPWNPRVRLTTLPSPGVGSLPVGLAGPGV